MNLRIGIDNLKSGWIIILKQIGLEFSRVSLSSRISPEDFSVIIVTARHNSDEINILNEYLKNDGAVLYSDNAIIDGISYKTKKVTSLYAKDHSPFSNIGFVDIFSTIKIPNSNELIQVDQGLMVTSLKKGNNLILPFNINESILNTRSRRKKFYANRKELPSEIVSEVSKGKLRKLVEKALEYLYHKRDLPFVHLWHQPNIDKNLFIFRLDTDFCSKEDAVEMYRICRNNNISATWFMDTDSDDRLKNYESMIDQEKAIHCDKHMVYDSYEDNFNNLFQADKKLKKYGISATGFAAPFGDWNTTLDKALQKMKLKYSSEFTLDYDDLPFFPNYEDKFSNVLQIPIHPISLGRLRRSHFSENEMFKYYLEIINEKLVLGEPVIIYHHPHHRHYEVFNKIFQFINSKGFGNMNLQEFSNWWIERNRLEPEFNYTDNKIYTKYDSQNVFVKISTKDGYAIIKKGEIQIDEINFKQQAKVELKSDLRRIRKFHWRDILYDNESRKSRRYFLKD
ncbi:MAG: hypothetical protein K9N07_08140 [Candidatus Cloacimonetes bacterium]|nr:hypothetical protein [Candidatus Cloacimonadota bacterium]